METRLLEWFTLPINDPCNPQTRLRTLASARALFANPNSSDSTLRAAIDALCRFLYPGNADFTFSRCVVKFLGDAAPLYGTFAPSIIELLRPFLDGNEKLAADALSALASVDGFLLDEVLVLSLASSPLLSVRSMLVKLIVSCLEGNMRNIVVIKPHVMIQVLLGFAEDLHPLIRAKAVDGLASVCRTTDSVQYVKCFHDFAASFLRDDEELVRLSAVRLISACGQFLARNKGDTHYCELMDAIFVQLCVMARDMNMKVRVEAFSAMGKVQGVSENMLLQSLSKKILGTQNIENTLVEHTLRNSKFPFSSSAGAFVHGIEDEFHEVRMVACKSIGILCILSIHFSAAALDLLLDTLNDHTVAVRHQALETLHQMAANDCLIIQEKHMHMFLSLLNDVGAITRLATRKLLLFVKLPKLEIFKAAINSLLTNLERHAEEEEDVFFVLFCIGISNAKFALKLAEEFASLVQPFSEGELSLDSPWAVGHLVLIISSTFSNKQNINDIPTVLFLYAVPLAGRISRSLGGFVSQSFLSNYLCNLSGIHFSFGIPMSEETKLTAMKLEETLADALNCRDKPCDSFLLFHDENMKSKFKEDRLELCRASTLSEQFLQSGGEMDDRLTQNIKFILGKVQETWSLIHSHCIPVALRILRACKEELDFIYLDINESESGLVAFGLEYVQLIMLFAEIWQQIHVKSFHVTAMAAFDILIEKLDASLRRIKYCFLGLSTEEESHLLELILVSHVLRLHKFGNFSPDILKRINSTISHLQILGKEGSNISAFVKEVRKLSTEEETDESSPEFHVDRLLQFFHLRLIPFCGKFEHIKADLMTFGNNSEKSLRFVSRLPVGITFDVVLYNTSLMERVWLQMAVGDVFQYIFIDVCKFRVCDNVRKCTLTIPFYATPRAASFVLRACICLEFPDGDVLNLKRKIGGPKREIIQISQETDVYFTGIGCS
ncbi:protein SIEL [Phalaenopsis equestris]|uniref:protein SIEL n=1 Tax=Phalaenopsis equestris TaxID=78828 RepID=UPI0009E64DD6|nr:protein SIEL [Phalaenopsis equestris]